QLPPGLDLAGGRFPLRALRRAVSGGGTEVAGPGLSLQRESPAVRAQPDCEELAALGEVIAPRGGERGILHPSVGGEPTRQPIGRRRQGAIGLDLSPTLLGADRPVQRRLALEDAASLLEVQNVAGAGTDVLAVGVLVAPLSVSLHVLEDPAARGHRSPHSLFAAQLGEVGVPGAQLLAQRGDGLLDVLDPRRGDLHARVSQADLGATVRAPLALQLTELA